MAKFLDRTGRPWLVEITVGAYRRLKRDTPLDLDAVSKDEKKLAEILYGEPFALISVMDCLLAPQFQAAGMTPEQVAEDFDPDTVDRFGMALVEAIIDFFHRSRAPLVREALGKMREAANTSPSNNSPASAPASADSIPPDSPSGNFRGRLPSGGV